ncbi:hypothetical protein BT69DRAFT_1302327 [Atractiella rhizophila]|nr:hypothetical protein BT69DRAFT_1302327 [Atractiella rhizophila]
MIGYFGGKLGETLAKTEHLLDKLRHGYTYNDFYHGTAVQAVANDNIGFMEDEQELVFIALTDGVAIHATVTPTCDVRAKRRHTFFTLGIPGPNNPVVIQSFFIPFYKAMANLSGGLWIGMLDIKGGLFGKDG